VAATEAEQQPTHALLQRGRRAGNGGLGLVGPSHLARCEGSGAGKERVSEEWPLSVLDGVHVSNDLHPRSRTARRFMTGSVRRRQRVGTASCSRSWPAPVRPLGLEPGHRGSPGGAAMRASPPARASRPRGRCRGGPRAQRARGAAARGCTPGGSTRTSTAARRPRRRPRRADRLRILSRVACTVAAPRASGGARPPLEHARRRQTGCGPASGAELHSGRKKGRPRMAAIAGSRWHLG